MRLFLPLGTRCRERNTQTEGEAGKPLSGTLHLPPALSEDSVAGEEEEEEEQDEEEEEEEEADTMDFTHTPYNHQIVNPET